MGLSTQSISIQLELWPPGTFNYIPCGSSLILKYQASRVYIRRLTYIAVLIITQDCSELSLDLVHRGTQRMHTGLRYKPRPQTCPYITTWDVDFVKFPKARDFLRMCRINNFCACAVLIHKIMRIGKNNLILNVI